jgi:ABC-type sulfate/molybdate transport systems ATPase subunit
MEPKVSFLDEPFAALDNAQMVRELKVLLRARQVLA